VARERVGDRRVIRRRRDETIRNHIQETPVRNKQFGRRQPRSGRYHTIQLRTCCPENCGTHAAMIRWLASWGIEPEIGLDEDGHFLECSPPKDERLKAFIFALLRRLHDGVICLCGRAWRSPELSDCYRCRCLGCGRPVNACGDCLRAGKITACPWCEEQPEGTSALAASPVPAM
jgi:hypothetical protein